MKNNIAFIVLLFLSNIGLAQSGPKIKILQAENTVDYGKVYKTSDNGVRSFTFTNTGDAPLSINGIQSTASCTILYKPSQSISPGKSDRIDIKYNMVPGPIRKTITLETNAVNYDEGRVPLKIKGEILSN
ncbi:DUF1573 domain-containing protein [Flavobacterium gilvum]|uniref:DUF1573 domain-containing protein n=1 Tax=Flavobacterium gilvum TaxID=1492737 RepID=A0AAC9N5E0_9FLAO|nr:DUF1573 domain-containing protein [Flavobacterium gilvum]AOW09596.1 hypothetical protein EM308_08820 [Flavobacterium gilvum]KFC58472.1 hypothetical protein FEM08_27540 [Flavobacterium gilvum]